METKQVKQENILAGTVGAFLGSILGGAAIVLVSQLGYFAAICGLIMAVCTLKGYELLGGRLTRKGAAISGVLILVMTYVAYQLDVSIEVARELSEWFEISVFQVFRSIMTLLKDGVLDARIYWGQLAMLYLFTLVGAVPTILGVLRGEHEMVDAVPVESSAVQGEAWDASFQIYGADGNWMKAVRLSITLPLLLMLFPLASIVLLLSARSNVNPGTMITSLAIFVLLMVIFVVQIRLLKPVEGVQQVFVRAGRDLFRVDLPKLNLIPDCRFTNSRIPLKGLIWNKLKEEERKRAEESIQKGIGTLMRGSGLDRKSVANAIQYLPDPQLEKEDKWVWTISYAVPTSTGNEVRKKMKIAKMYPNFAPVYDVTPPTGPASANWAFVAVILVLSLGATAVLWSMI